MADESGAVLPGATVTLSGPRHPLHRRGSQGTSASWAGKRAYKLAVALTGFTTVNREVVVITGQNVNLTFGMKVATRRGDGDRHRRDPHRRHQAPRHGDHHGARRAAADPERARSLGRPQERPRRAGRPRQHRGQRERPAGVRAGKGSTTTDKTWNIDGLVVTDMSATGASPSYFDFDAFQEINVTTGGADLTMQTGGIGINLVTKRGTNNFHGGARYSSPTTTCSRATCPTSMANDSAPANPDGTQRDKADHIDQITDYGFDLGGPIVKDKLWFYGTYGKQDIRLPRLNGTADKTLLPSYNAKLNWQATGSTMVSAFYFVGSKQKFGRDVGFARHRDADGFTWNQDNAYTDGGLPGGLWKAEVNHTFSPNFFMSAKAAYYDTGFGLDRPRRRRRQTYTLDYVDGRGHGSYETTRPSVPRRP